MKIEEIHNLELEPLEVVNSTKGLKNYVLFSIIEDKEVACISKDHISIAFDYLSKLEVEYDVIFLNDISYERLYNKVLEKKADKEMSDIQSEHTDQAMDEDDLSIVDFLKNSSDILTSEESAPIIKFVNSIFYQALKKNASDIHIEVHEYKAEVRYRIDGVLSRHIELDAKIMSLVISRIKVISNLDISEKRVPQDGRTQVKLSGKTLDIRVSILPTFYGERVVMRILMQSESIPALEELGFENKVIEQLEGQLDNSYGMVLVTGPTGSGKSTTLHSVLKLLETTEKNIVTIEDPVEYKSDKINQIQVNQKVGLTFASGLRSILRQDPDIIMVGEIRDAETAKIAIQSALTGHLVFSTLHTNSAVSTVTRLIDMGVEKFLISSSLLGVLAQRLVRKLCSDCKEEDEIAESYAQEYGISSDTIIYKSCGCEKCNYTGYTGRKALGEFFVLDNDIKDYLRGEVDDISLSELAVSKGMKPISEQLKTMLRVGETSLDEVIRLGLK